MNYKLTERNGEVNYLMMAGNSVVRHHTPLATATWACENNKVKQEALAGHPEYCVHAGEFYFEGMWQSEKKPTRRKKDAVCE